MKTSIKYREKNFMARFTRAIFFVSILSCSAHSEYPISFGKRTTIKITSTPRSRIAHARPQVRPRTTLRDLLRSRHLNPDIFLELQSLTPSDMQTFLQTKTKNELLTMKKSLGDFLYKFNHDKKFRKQVRKFSNKGFPSQAYHAVCKALDDLRIYHNPAAFETFCHDFLKIKVGKTAVYLLQRFMMGLEQGGIDVLSALRKKQRKGLSGFAPGFLQKVKNQSIKQTMGDMIQLLSKKIVHASAVIVAIAAIAITLEAGTTLATSTAGVIAAKKFFEPLELAINPDGSAAVTQAASSGISIWQAIANSLSQAIQTLYGLVEQADGWFWVMGDGGGGKTAHKTIEFSEKQLQKKFKHAKFFGVDSPWNKTAAQKYKRAILEFINDEATEIMQALYKKKAATYYINKSTRLFVVKINEIYRTGWKLTENQLENFLRSGNLS